MPKKFIQHNLKLCAIGFGNFLTPSTRYRLLQFIPFFEDKGALVQTKISSDLTKWSNFSEFILSENNHASSQNQIIWIQKNYFLFIGFGEYLNPVKSYLILMMPYGHLKGEIDRR